MVEVADTRSVKHEFDSRQEHQRKPEVTIMDINKIEKMVDKLISHQKQLEGYSKNISELIIMTSMDAISESQGLRENLLRQGEKMYLDFKKISQELSSNEPSPFYEKYGEMVDFDAHIEYMGDDKWKLHLPTFSPIATRRKQPGDGKFIYYLVFNMLQKEKEARSMNDEKRPRILNKPMVLFEYHIAPGPRVFDMDNTDAKSAIDGMHGFFFTDDNAFKIDLAETSVEDEDQYTDIYVMESPLSIKK